MDNKKIVKVGILTFHFADNYGAVLQAMSLQDFIVSQGFECSVINYLPMYVKHNARIILTDTFRHFVISIINLPSKVLKRYKFRHFRDVFLNCTKNVYGSYDQLKDGVNDYDVVIFGSDQIWNPNLTGGLDKAYFGEWDSSNRQKKIAYAASIGVSNFTDFQIQRIQDLSKNLNRIGIREPEVESVIHRNAQVVCDPVLLNDKDYWNSIIPDKKKNKKPYILVYSLSGYPELYELARIIRSKTCLDVFEIRAGYKISKKVNREKVFKALGPDSFVSMIKNAEYVITDSFHGTAFSLIFGRNFFVIPNKTKGGRMIHLLEKVGLNDLIITNQDINDSIDLTPYNTTAVEERLKEFRSISRSFLDNALNN
jgi:hypothetical protein